MDLIKIGKYIAEKRKALGLTQKQCKRPIRGCIEISGCCM